MNLARLAAFSPFVFLLAGCDLGSLQYPPGPNQYPSSQSQPQFQATTSQRTQYIWDKALEGMTMGGALAGPYGAGGGLVIGLIAGLFSADGHYAQLNNQIQTEQNKDKELEAKIEQEIERQRQLDAQLEAQLANSAGNPPQQKQPEPPQPAQKLSPPKITTVAMKDSSAPTLKPAPTGAVASLPQKENPAKSPSSPFKNVELRDINGDGIPDLWIYYNPLKPTEIVRQEEASHWDGRADTWSYFKDGKLVRREVDSNGKGRADTVYYYDNDKIVREEHDENGSGNMSSRVIYQNGRRAKLEKDTSGAGKTDHWIYYDTTRDGEIVLKEERDLNGDGLVDQWSYYENGRLVRRDLSAVGLEILTKQDELLFPPADSKQISQPKPVKDNKGRS
jgi:hypothetical protein